MCSLINKQLLLTAYACLFTMEQQEGQQGSEALQLQSQADQAKAVWKWGDDLAVGKFLPMWMWGHVTIEGPSVRITSRPSGYTRDKDGKLKAVKFDGNVPAEYDFEAGDTMFPDTTTKRSNIGNESVWKPSSTEMERIARGESGLVTVRRLEAPQTHMIARSNRIQAVRIQAVPPQNDKKAIRANHDKKGVKDTTAKLVTQCVKGSHVDKKNTITKRTWDSWPLQENLTSAPDWCRGGVVTIRGITGIVSRYLFADGRLTVTFEDGRTVADVELGAPMWQGKGWEKPDGGR